MRKFYAQLPLGRIEISEENFRAESRAAGARVERLEPRYLFNASSLIVASEAWLVVTDAPKHVATPNVAVESEA